MAHRVKLITAGMVELMRAPAMQRMLYDALGPAEAQARATAPRASGQYAASIHRTSGVSGDRAAARLVASAPHSLALEARTGNLARALDAAKGMP